MRIAVASQDGTAVSQHFGRSTCFLVFETDGRNVLSVQTREASDSGCGHSHGEGHDHSAGHSHGHDDASHSHSMMIEPILDCDILMCGGMGRRAADALAMQGVRPMIVPADAEPATLVQWLLEGRLAQAPMFSCQCHH